MYEIECVTICAITGLICGVIGILVGACLQAGYEPKGRH